LAKEKIYVDFDSLGVQKTMMAGYLTKLHLCLTNWTTLKALLCNALTNVAIDLELASTLDLSVKNSTLKPC